MSVTSYPSPVSSASPSPSVDPIPVETLSETYVRSQPDVAARRRASLRAAYRRIEQVRRSLYEPDTISSSSEHSQIAPNHEAIFLAGSQTEERIRRSQPLPPGALERLAHYERSQVLEGEGERPPRPTRQALASLNTLPSIEYLPRTVLNSPVSPTRQNMLPRRSLLETQIRRRDFSEDPSTFLGRHVAAREAAGNQDPSTRPADSRRDWEIFRYLTRQRRSEPANSDNSRGTENERSTRSLDTSVLRGTFTTSPTAARSLVNNFRYRRPPRTESRQPSTPSSGSQMAERLSLLSNLSVQNLSTPTSTVSRERPLLFEEPSSYVNSPTTLYDTESDVRSYAMRRLTNAQGDEVVHNISLDMDDDPQLFERLQEGTPRLRHRPLGRRLRDPVAQSTLVISSSLDRLRRNLASLDPDGDLLPLYDEDENVGDDTGRDVRVPLLVPLTRDSFSPDDDLNELPRVRLNSRDLDYYSMADENTIHCHTKAFGTDIPPYIDPLPMPLEKMVPSKQDTSEGIRVHSKFALLAGR